MKFYKSRSGEKWASWEDAMINDLCHMITDHADRYHGGDVMKMFQAGKLVQEVERQYGRSFAERATASFIETEGRVIVHWIMNNLPLLEGMIAYYLDEKVKETASHKN